MRSHEEFGSAFIPLTSEPWEELMKSPSKRLKRLRKLGSIFFRYASKGYVVAPDEIAVRADFTEFLRRAGAKEEDLFIGSPSLAYLVDVARFNLNHQGKLGVLDWTSLPHVTLFISVKGTGVGDRPEDVYADLVKGGIQIDFQHLLDALRNVLVKQL